MDLNLVVLAGKLAVEPEHRVFDSGTHVLRMLVTVRGDAPRGRVDVVPVMLWDPPTDLMSGALCAGERIWLTGTVQRRFWESAEGRRSRLEIVAHRVQRAHDVETTSQGGQ